MKSQLLQPLSSLKNIGPAVSKVLTNLIGQDRVFNLLLHLPIRAEKISFCPRLFEVKNDELIIIKVKVESHALPTNSRQPHKIICYTASGYISLVFFKIFPSQLNKLAIGREVFILGHFKRVMGENQITHPQEIIDVSDAEKLPKINIIYPLSFGITQKFLQQKIKESLNKIGKNSVEWLDINLLKKQNWPNFVEALTRLHNPTSESDFLPTNLARKRLAYDELLAWQIAILMAKNFGVKNKKQINISQNLTEIFLSKLPFELTQAQQKVMNEIKNDICSDKKMLRLLQGDVGSGKTIPAIFACLLAISQKKQTCVIVPITILAKQHFIYFKKLLEALDIRIELLISATTKKQKAKILQELSDGKIDILISTHAALEDDIKFKNLGLAIIDEQHRFGVMQRLKLVEKGEEVDVLLMSATPIPRSLMMGLYGDMDISILDQKPKNRQAIETLIMSEKKVEDVYEAIRRAVAKGDKIYWICPAIEEMDDEIKEEKINFNPDSQNINHYPTLHLASAKEKYEKLSKVFDNKIVGLIHGKMKESEKEKIMSEFIKPDGDLKILVATTVIEVGIDVPDATIIIIENAENFGLSQLHQLRGRVGRSEKKSYCILLYGERFGANGRKRLNILRESNDGFFIAEEDLKMRGSGELLGTKQSGFPEFKIANLNFDSDLLKIARKNAEVILHEDLKLENSKNLEYQNLLELFGYDNCLKMIDGG